jgi:hypothetical protein
MFPPSPRIKRDRHHDEQGKDLWSSRQDAAAMADLDEAILDGIDFMRRCNCTPQRVGSGGEQHHPKCAALDHDPSGYVYCSGCGQMEVSSDIAVLDGWEWNFKLQTPKRQCPQCQDMGGMTC